MKHLAFLFLVCAAAAPVLAQPHARPAEPPARGIFGGPLLAVSSFNEQSALLVGGQGGWRLGSRMGVGVGAYRLLSNVKPDVIECDCGNPLYLNAGYGGVALTYFLRPQRRLHGSLQLLVGAGGLGYQHDDGGREPHEHPVDIHDKDAFFVAEPGFSLMLETTRFLRIGIGAGYRWTRGAGLTGAEDAHLRSPSGLFTLQFGQR